MKRSGKKLVIVGLILFVVAGNMWGDESVRKWSIPQGSINARQVLDQLIGQNVITSESLRWLNSLTIWCELNGDGLIDVLVLYGGIVNDFGYKAYLNKGNGSWARGPGWDIRTMEYDFHEYLTVSFFYWGMEFIDINGDGMTDVLTKDHTGQLSGSVILNTGTGWELDLTKLPRYFR